jgi:hypothetical protein
MPQNHNRTMTLSKMAYSDNPKVASSYSFQIYVVTGLLFVSKPCLQSKAQ